MSKQKDRKVARERARPTPFGTVRVALERLAPYNSYGSPTFVARGYYEDLPFTCADCGEPQVWRASQQKWWYEVAKGHVESRAIRCRPCRARERAERGLAKPRGWKPA